MFFTLLRALKLLRVKRASKVVQCSLHAMCRAPSSLSPPPPPHKVGLRQFLNTSGDGTSLFLYATSLPFTALTVLIFIIYSILSTSWAQLSAETFANTSFNLLHSPRNVITSIFQFGKLREINCLPKIPQLVSGRARR